MPFEWEEIGNFTHRAKVIGGWIVRSTWSDTAESMVFIADKDLEWRVIEPKADPIIEQSTLANDFKC